MDSGELFELLKQEAKHPSIVDLVNRQMGSMKDVDYSLGSLEYKLQLMTKYNLEIFSEISNRDSFDNTEDINQALLEEFSVCIDKYMDENAPGQTDLKRYIKIVSTYLAFIAKRPLHPVGMSFSKNQRITSKGDKFFCPVKNKQLGKEMSLCKYCACLDISQKESNGFT